MADIEVQYKGSTIKQQTGSGTVTLHTEGKYMEDDVDIVYTAPGGGGVPEFVYDEDAGSYTFAEDLYTNPANFYPQILGNTIWGTTSASQRRVYYLWEKNNTMQNYAFLCGCVILQQNTPPLCITSRQDTSGNAVWHQGTGSAIMARFTTGTTVYWAILKNPKIDTI